MSELVDRRSETHGEPSMTLRMANNLRKTVSGVEVAAMDPVLSMCLIMIFVKIARIVCGSPDFRDHWDDIAGYAEIASKRVDENTPF